MRSLFEFDNERHTVICRFTVLCFNCFFLINIILFLQRCQERLKLLAILVINMWSAEVKLEVTKAWKDPQFNEIYHPDLALHYEGKMYLK